MSQPCIEIAKYYDEDLCDTATIERPTIDGNERRFSLFQNNVVLRWWLSHSVTHVQSALLAPGLSILENAVLTRSSRFSASASFLSMQSSNRFIEKCGFPMTGWKMTFETMQISE